MKRIGIAASRISKGNSLLYHSLVVVISCLVSFFLYVVVGSTVVFALAIIAYVSNETADQVRATCLIVLGFVIAVFNLMAIIINIRWPHKNP